MHNNEQETSSQVGSWGRFARRIYIQNGNARNQRHSETSGDPKDTVWLYVAISVVYVSLIGLVLLILIFAPKFRLPAVHEDPEIENQIAAETQGQPQISETLNDSKEIIATENYFEASPRDPVYDIDPRSSIFRGDIYDDYRRTDSRPRLNSRFRHV